MATRSIAREALFLDLARQNQAKFRRLALAYARPAGVEDLLQDIWLQIWRSLPSFDDKSQLATWAWRVALNTCLGHARRARPEPETLEDDVHPAASAGDAAAILEDFANQLNEIDRAVLLLHLDGCDHAEAGDILGISRNAFAIRLTRIRKQFESRYVEN